MNMRAGFSLIECLVYCFLFCMLTVLVFGWVGALQVSLAKKDKESMSDLDIYSSLDLFIRDAMNCPRNAVNWKKITPTQIIWHRASEDIGWNWHDGALYRITGEYNGTTWINKFQSLVSNTTERIHFSVIQNKNEITSVTWNSNIISRRIVLRNRIFYDEQ